MLTDLTIRNLALIEEARLTFGGGLNAITGETGAGKSLLVSSLELLSGGRLRRGSAAQWVRHGTERAEVEGRFHLTDGRVVRRVEACLERELPAFVPEWEEDENGERELLLARALDSAGRSRAWINHRPVTRRALEQVAAALFEIHGQNSHQRLLEPDHQVELLDASAGLEGLRERYQAARTRWQRAERELARLHEERDEQRERIALLRFRREELADFEPSEDEPVDLRDERQRLRHGAELARESGGWLDALSEGDSAATDRLRSVEREIDRWVERIESLEGVRAELEAARVHLEEAVASLLSFSEDVDLDPRRLEWIEGRLAEYERLAKVHGAEPERLVEVLAELERQLDATVDPDEGLEASAVEREAALEELDRVAVELAEARRAAAAPLVSAARVALRGLGLAKAEMAVEFGGGALVGRAGGSKQTEVAPFMSDRALFVPLGPESVELLLAANPGEPMRPLRDVASGGETARIVLALRSALAGCEEPRALVFDEIDTGVGGRLGPALARHMRSLGEHHQVLTVTHLPAIAASAHRHQVVRKAVRRGRTRTAVALLEGDERIGEVADMIAGGAQAATARAEAERLLGAVAG